MKRKILIGGKNSALIMDFIQHTEDFFYTLSTTECRQDVFGHFKVFEPDAFVCFVDRDYEKTVGLINSLKNDSCYNGAAIMLIGDAETCSEIGEKARYTADVLICRPVSPDNLTLRITRYFDDIAEAKERLKAREQARQTEEEARKAAIEAKAAAIAAKEAGAAEGEKKKHILIVDDDRTVLKMLKTALGEQYDITAMINGVMVDKCLETKKVDLIILDYEMPIETGAEIFRRIKKDPKAAHIPVCFLTGVSEREKIMEVMALKPHGYLLKPIDMEMLSATIRTLIN